MSKLPERYPNKASRPPAVSVSHAPALPLQTGGQVPQRSDALGPANVISYSSSPGFAAMDSAWSEVGPDFHQFLSDEVPHPAGDMWYASRQTYSTRMTATVLLVGSDRLLAVEGQRPMLATSSVAQGRPQLRPGGPWKLDYVRLNFAPSSVHVARLPANQSTLPGGRRAGSDKNPDIVDVVSNLPTTVQEHLEVLVPRSSRLRRWQRCLGPTTSAPERMWLFVTSVDRLAYCYAQRHMPRDPSGMSVPRDSVPWEVALLTAMIGPATRSALTLSSGWRSGGSGTSRTLSPRQ